MKLCVCAAWLGLLISLPYYIAVGENWRCGTLNEAQLYNEKPVAAMDEFPWIARIYFTERSTNSSAFNCAGVLISQRHVLTSARCFGPRLPFNQPDYVILGDSDYGNLNTERDCDVHDNCAPMSQQYRVNDVVYHPNFDRRQRLNDIALLHLTADVAFNAYVQPICLPPPSSYNAELLAQYFSLAGFVSEPSMKKTKSIAHVSPIRRCILVFHQLTGIAPVIDAADICTSFYGDYAFIPGSILMGVDIVNGTLSNYYLLGIFSYGAMQFLGVDYEQYHVFMKISSRINWIQANMQHSLTMHRNDLL